jgi:outer membrane immunogenic protein
MKRLLLSVAALLIVGPAVAADMARPVMKAPVMAPAYSWTGCYIGAQGGWGFGTSKGVLRDSSGTQPVNYSLDTDGGIAGGHIGCQWQSGMWVWGLEGDGEWSDLKETGRFGPPTFAAGTYTIDTEVRGMGSIRGRLGWALGDRWLVYGTGGWAVAGVRTNYALTGSAPFHTEDRTRSGWTAGGGVEWSFAPAWTARAEYRFTDLGSKSFVDTASNSADNNKISFHAVRFGLSYHFGGPVVARY